jgi:DNA-directed RNA polymerase
MLRDEVGGKATNLVNASKPSDIYDEVALVVKAKLRSSPTDTAARWLAFGITRSTTKRPVMTLPYGSTQQSCREYLLQSYLEAKGSVFDKTELIEAINYLTKIVWESIGEVVVAARSAMAWLQTVSSILAKKNLPIEFTSPSGFVIHQDIKQIETHIVKTVLCGRTRIHIGTPTDKIDVLRQRNGIAPNFVHSCDAAHLVGTLLLAKAAGITHVAAIHDDYGVHACDTQAFAGMIRTAFVEQYSENVLLRLHTELSTHYPDIKLPLPPEYGTLDIREVLTSDYFFG